MERSGKKTLKKTTTTQFEVLVQEMDQNPDLARGVPMFGSDRARVEERWDGIMRKINAHGPPTRSAIEWKKIWADLKSRTKKKIADNLRNLNLTGGGPFRHAPLTEIEKTIDRIISITKAAAPSGTVLGIARPSTSQTAASTSDHSSASDMPALFVVRTPTVRSSRGSPYSVASHRSLTHHSPLHRPLIPPVGVITPTRNGITPTPSTKARRTCTRKQTFQESIAESARIQAETAQQQAEAAKKTAEASMLQVDAINRLVEVVSRQTDALERVVGLLSN